METVLRGDTSVRTTLTVMDVVEEAMVCVCLVVQMEEEKFKGAVFIFTSVRLLTGLEGAPSCASEEKSTRHLPELSSNKDPSGPLNE